MALLSQNQKYFIFAPIFWIFHLICADSIADCHTFEDDPDVQEFVHDGECVECIFMWYILIHDRDKAILLKY